MSIDNPKTPGSDAWTLKAEVLGHARRKLYILIAVTSLIVLLLLGYQLRVSYQGELREARITTRNYAAIFETRLDDTLRRIDAELLECADRLPVGALNKEAVPHYAREIDAGLDTNMVSFPELAGMRVFDADGDLLYTSASAGTPRTNIADRSYFHALRDNPRMSLVFSEVISSRITNRQSLVVARSLKDRHGAFRGIVLAVIELEHLQKLLRSLDLGSRGIIAIRRSDDFRGVAGWPTLEREINKPLPPGTPTREAIRAGKMEAVLEFPAATDGIVRIFHFRVLERYPFFVVAGLARDDVLAGWRTHVLGIGGTALSLLGLLSGLLYRLLRTEMREYPDTRRPGREREPSAGQQRTA